MIFKKLILKQSYRNIEKIMVQKMIGGKREILPEQMRSLENGLKQKILISDIGNVIMPYYNHGGVSITPEEGAPLSVAYNNVNNNINGFSKNTTIFHKKGAKLMKINSRQKKLMNPQIFFAFASFLQTPSIAAKNILPPSIGPRGNKLNNPMPKFMTTNQKTSMLIHETKEGTNEPYFSTIDCLGAVFKLKSATPMNPLDLLSGFSPAIISYVPLSVTSLTVSFGLMVDVAFKNVSWLMVFWSLMDKIVTGAVMPACAAG